MPGKVFVDANVLVYCRDSTEPEKQQQAEAWMAELWRFRKGCLSFQVLQEYYVTVTVKLDPGLSPANARADVGALFTWRPVETTQSIVETAWHIEDRFDVSWWDSLIVSAAQSVGAAYLLSEDFQHGMDFDGVKVCSPFRGLYADLT